MDKNPYWDDFEAPSGTPADHKSMRDSMFERAAQIPVPPGVEGIQDTAPRAANSVRGADGSEVSFYVETFGDNRQIYATVSHPDGYAEFILREGAWRYLSKSVVMWSGFTSTYLDDLDATEVPLPPPTLKDAHRQSGA